MELTITTEYRARPGSRLSDEDAATVGPVLEALAIEGRSTAADIVAEATPEESPLHKFFTWDDSAAAAAYRLAEARRLAASVVVTVAYADRPESEPVRAFFAVRPDSAMQGQARSYRTIRMVQESERESAQVLSAALRSLASWAAKYRTYRSLFESHPTLHPVYLAVEHALAAAEDGTEPG